MPPLLTEQDFNSPPSAEQTGSSSPLSHENASMSPAEVRKARTEQVLSDIAELKSQIFLLRTDVARSSSSLKKTTVVTGIFVVLAILLGIAGLGPSILPGTNGSHEAGRANDGSMTALRAEIDEVRTTMKSLNSRPDREPEKAVARLNCSNLRPDLKANTVDFLIQFQVRGAKISPTSEETLDTIAKMLGLTPDHCVLIEGHADATGKTEKNMTLSKERADLVARYITEKARVERNNIVTIGKGSSSPLAGLAPNDPQNRRAVVRVVTGSALGGR